jgi:hypothetical protein
MLILLRDNLCRNLERPLMSTAFLGRREKIGLEVCPCMVSSKTLDSRFRGNDDGVGSHPDGVGSHIQDCVG